ncbi:MAG: hypothetical protein ABJB12_06915 [Pseudomonadota bacterium]
MSQNDSLPPQDDFARALLRSAELDEPSSTAYAKVAAALGVSTAVGVGASLSAPAALAAGSSGLVRWSGSLGGKLALLGVSGALLVAAGGALLRQRLAADGARAATGASAANALGQHAPVKARLAAQPAPALALGATRAAPEAAASLPSPAHERDAAAAPEAPPASDAAQAANASVKPALANPRPEHALGRVALTSSGVPRVLSNSGAASSSLSEQVQSLDRARVALGSGDARAALVEIAHYRKAWPEGVFLTEASVLEIEALAKRGQRALAAARAQAFVTAHPDSPQAERLRALIAAPAERP